jgi:hypothetical protein
MKPRVFIGNGCCVKARSLPGTLPEKPQHHSANPNGVAIPSRRPLRRPHDRHPLAKLLVQTFLKGGSCRGNFGSLSLVASRNARLFANTQFCLERLASMRAVPEVSSFHFSDASIDPESPFPVMSPFPARHRPQKAPVFPAPRGRKFRTRLESTTSVMSAETGADIIQFPPLAL